MTTNTTIASSAPDLSKITAGGDTQKGKDFQASAADSSSIPRLRLHEMNAHARDGFEPHGSPGNPKEPPRGVQGGSDTMVRAVFGSKDVIRTERLSRKVSFDLGGASSEIHTPGRKGMVASASSSRVTSWDSLYGSIPVSAQGQASGRPSMQDAATRHVGVSSLGAMSGISEMGGKVSSPAGNRISRSNSHGSVLSASVGDKGPGREVNRDSRRSLPDVGNIAVGSPPNAYSVGGSPHHSAQDTARERWRIPGSIGSEATPNGSDLAQRMVSNSSAGLRTSTVSSSSGVSTIL
jgi:hypothetical protein